MEDGRREEGGGRCDCDLFVLELDLVVPLRLNLSLSYLERQGRSIFVMCVKLP